MSEVSKTILKNILLQKRSFSELIVTNNIYRKTRLNVIGGPFKGLKYINASSGGAYFPKLLGIYEKELIPVLENLKGHSFSHIINVGGGEGYYTCGLGKMFTEAKLITYEPGLQACYLMETLAIKNNLRQRLHIKAQLCFPNDLEAELLHCVNPLVFMDVEGAEHDLLNPRKVKGLEKASIIVEIHDTVSPTLGVDICNWLSQTHTRVEIPEQERTLKDIPYNSGWKKIFKKAYLKTISEGRGYKMRWFYFEPK